jgi:hypothetical protein
MRKPERIEWDDSKAGVVGSAVAEIVGSEARIAL